MDGENNKMTSGSLVEDCNSHLKTRQRQARQAYEGQKSSAVSDEQIADLLPMVPKIVQRVVTYLKPPLSREDLISAGTVGLVKAARDYDPSRQAEFKTYAYIRIRGAILDELRNWSFVPPNVDKQIRRALRLSIEITEQTGSTPRDEDLAKRLNVSIEQLYEIFEGARAKHFLSIDGSSDEIPSLSSLLPAAETATPEQDLERSELVDKLVEAIQQLDQRQRQIIVLYYQQQLTMKQIAELFNITEPRVSQIHAGALFNLAVKLGQWNDGR